MNGPDTDAERPVEALRKADPRAACQEGAPAYVATPTLLKIKRRPTRELMALWVKAVSRRSGPAWRAGSNSDLVSGRARKG